MEDCEALTYLENLKGFKHKYPRRNIHYFQACSRDAILIKNKLELEDHTYTAAQLYRHLELIPCILHTNRHRTQQQ